MDINALKQLTDSAKAALQAATACEKLVNSTLEMAIENAVGKDQERATKLKAKANLLMNKAKRGEDVQLAYKKLSDEYRNNK